VLAVLCVIVSLTLGSCASTVKKAEELFTPSVKSEKEMGQEFAQEAAKHLNLIEDPEILEYINRIGEPIIDAAQPMSYRFRFHVVKNPTLNAFAVPGGHLYLFSGLLLKARGANEVAGVIAHELAHVKHRHTAQMVGKGTLVSLLSLAAIVAGGATGAGGQAGPAVAAGALGASAAAQLSFSREFEQEADRYGLFYLYQARYDTHGLLDFLSTVEREERFATSKIPSYLLTHPMSPERMAQVEHLIEVNRLQVRESRDIPDFYRFQGLLMAEAGEAAYTIPLLKQKAEESPRDPQRWHQLALVYNRFGWTQEAILAFQKALDADPNLCPALVDYGALLVRMGKGQEAETLFQRAASLRPDYAPAYVRWGETLLQRNQIQEANASFAKALALEPHLIRVHELRAKARKEAKDEGGYHEEMATYYEKLDRLREAIKHLREAVKIYGETSERGEEVKRRIEFIRSS
jgi:predicted Zn-dependent protease